MMFETSKHVSKTQSVVVFFKILVTLVLSNRLEMSFKNACVCDANAVKKLSRYCRDHIQTRGNIFATANTIVASAEPCVTPLKQCTVSWTVCHDIAYHVTVC